MALNRTQSVLRFLFERCRRFWRRRRHYRRRCRRRKRRKVDEKRRILETIFEKTISLAIPDGA